MNFDTDILSQIIRRSPIPTFVIDADHRITHWNHACEVITGVLSADIVGKTEAWSAFYSEERPVMADLILDGRIEDIFLFYKISPSTSGALRTFFKKICNFMTEPGICSLFEKQFIYFFNKGFILNHFTTAFTAYNGNRHAPGSLP